MKEQAPENKEDRNDKNTLRANCACTLEMHEGEKIKRETRVNTAARKESPVREEEIRPTKLSEMIDKEINNSIKEINNSIRDAVRAIVRQCSMEERKSILPCSKEPEEKPRAYRACVTEEHRKKSSNVYADRQITNYVSRYNNLPTRSNSHLCAKIHENNAMKPLPMINKVNNEKKNKRHAKSANNMNTDNRRMTGNVNIYICSETNDNGQERKKSKLQSCTDTSSATTSTEQSNSRYVSSASSCKLINSIQEKRKKQAQQLLDFNREKRDGSSNSSDDNVVYDNRTSRSVRGKELNERGTKQVDIKVNDDNFVRQDAISSTRDDCCCRDTSISSVDFRQDSSNSVVSCSSFDALDNSKRPPWATVCPFETRAVLCDFSSNVIRSNSAERGNYRKNDDCNNVCGNDTEYTVCRAIDDSEWLPTSKSIYTDCAARGKFPEGCLADSKYRNKRDQCSILNRNDIRKRQMGSLQQIPTSCQREHMARRWSTCSCIAEEEEENRCAKTDKVERKLPESRRNGAKCPEKISVCRTPLSELTDATVCEMSFRAGEERFAITQTCESTLVDSVECPRGTAVRGTTFGNSEELSKVTRVCKEFVTVEPPKDITVCRTTFGEPRGPPKEVTVCETAPPDSEGAPKETICKKIPVSNFANQDDVKGVSSSDAKDKFPKENADSVNLNNRKGSAGDAEKVTRPDNKHDSVAPNHFTGQESAKSVKQNERTEETVSNDQSKIPIASVGSIKDSKSLSRNIYPATLLRAQPSDRPILISNPNKKEILEALVKRKTMRMQLSPNRSIRNHFQQPDKIPMIRDLTSNDLFEEKIQEKSKEERKKQDIPKEIGITEEKERESLLHRSLKRLIDAIKRSRLTKFKYRLEAEKIESGRAIANDKQNVEESIVPEIEDRISDAKDQQEVGKKTATPRRFPLTSRVREENRKIDISRIHQATPKLLRIIAAKRSHLPSTVTTAERQEPEVEPFSSEIITNGDVDLKIIPKEKISPRESIPTEVTEEIKTEDTVALEINGAEVEMSIKDIPNDVPKDIPKEVADEERVAKEIVDEATKMYVVCPQKKPEEEPREPVPRQCGLPPDPNGCSCLISKRAKILPCPQKKSDEEPRKSTLCKCDISSTSNGCSCSIVKCAKCNNPLEDCLCKDEILEQKEDYCAHCRLSRTQCACAPTRYLKSCLKTDKPKFRSVSPSKISPRICTNCRGIREECKCKKTVCCQPREECRCGRCATHGNYSTMIDRCKCRPPACCISCCGSRDQCRCATFALAKYREIKKGCNCKRTMICLYCDNSQDKCTCRAPIGKCPCCGLSSDVCGCRNDEDHERIANGERNDETRTIRVTSWEPKREIRRYFARNEDLQSSYSIEECRCYGKSKRQCPEELPYQRLNIFSDVMNELQQKMSESVCCTRCWRNPCCCGSQIGQDAGEKGREDNSYVRCPEIEKSSRSRSPRSKSAGNKSPNNRRCGSSARNERENIVQKSISARRICCVCELSPCRCGKNRSGHKRPLAKCYYCKSLPCACITAR